MLPFSLRVKYPFKNKLLVLSLSLALIGCKEEPIKSKRSLIPDLRPYVEFNVNTWWMYQDTFSGQYDSQYVVRYTNEYSALFDDDAVCYEEAQCYLVANKNELDTFGFRSSAVGSLLNIFKKESNKNSIHYLLLDFPIRQGQTWNAETLEQIVTVDTVVDSLNINGHEYKSIVIVNVRKNPIEGYKETNYYLVSGVGIVRKEFVNKNECWDLLQYEIK